VEAASSSENFILAHLTADHHNQKDKNIVHHNSLSFIKVENFLSRTMSARCAIDIWTLALKRVNRIVFKNLFTALKLLQN
jgi:hypothetical protein